ncbi:hypothetical protein TCAL_01704 [Tigriopus californicus]|uniref:Peptidase S1 domain-containing protein n=1 Tax=Tigriopus californicus TaxID=6832 RepID=A0A553PMI8_TIGCA|nr:brachyurin-like [Tigriopus californicus]TRY78901.1 hypothetical protein TCAL_01704 [Tigriopus californicus]
MKLYSFSLVFLGLTFQGHGSTSKIIRDLSKYRDPRELFGVTPLVPSLGSTLKIVGGQEVVPNSYPFVVALFVDGLYFCGGSILSDNRILTAAHCVDGRTYIEVVAGAHNVQQDEPDQEVVATLDYTVHENWNFNITSGFDVAVVKLNKPLVLNDKVGTISRAQADPTIGEKTTAIGWGKPRDSAPGISATLNYVDGLPVISDEECSLIYGPLSPATLCVSSEGGHGTCSGDSGGPLINVNSELVGITSFTSGEGCELGFPDGFTSVADFNIWIDANLE